MSICLGHKYELFEVFFRTTRYHDWTEWNPNLRTRNWVEFRALPPARRADKRCFVVATCVSTSICICPPNLSTRYCTTHIESDMPCTICAPSLLELAMWGKWNQTYAIKIQDKTFCWHWNLIQLCPSVRTVLNEFHWFVTMRAKVSRLKQMVIREENPPGLIHYPRTELWWHWFRAPSGKRLYWLTKVINIEFFVNLRSTKSLH